MQWKTGRRFVVLGFVLAVAILIFAGWESYRNTARFAAAAEWQKHTYEVLSTLDETVARLVDAETAERGYVLTGDEAYLEPYRTGIKNLDLVIDRLKELTSDNPNQQKRIQALEPLVDKRIARIQEIIEIRKTQGMAAANQMVMQGSGKLWMDQIRALVAEMAKEEKYLLNIRTQTANQSAARSARTILAGSFVSVFLLVLVFALLNHELSQRKLAQEALRKSEEWLSTTLSSIGDAVIATDMNGAVTFLNPVAQSLTGWSLEECRGKSMDLVFDIVNAETRRPVENPVKKVFREGKIVGLADHTVLISKNKREFDIEDSAAPILTETGKTFGVVLVFRDITERKKMEEAAKTNEQRLNLALDSAQMGIWELDLVNDKAYRNLRHDQIFGYPSLQPNWGQEDFMAHVVPQDRDAVKKSFEEAFVTGDFSLECRIIWPDKSIHWMSARGCVFRNDKGVPARMMGTVADITERKQAQQMVEMSEKRLAGIVSSAMDAIIAIDEQQRITPFNPAAEKMFGWPAAEVMGQPLNRLMPSQFHAAHHKHVGSFANSGVTARSMGALPTLSGRRANGEEFPIEATVSQLEASGQKLFTAIVRDITDRKQAEQALVHAKEEAERASKFKDQFLSTMSHELRTPLNAILGFSELLTDARYGPLNERQARYVNHINAGGKHLLKLISDILDLSKIEAGRMEIVREDVAVASAYAEVLSALHPLADKKSQTLRQQVDPGLCVRADVTRFKQILMNLVGNAIKFTPEGSRIELAARRVDGQVRVEVRDNGPGIPPEEQQRIFQSFYRRAQAGNSTEGTGLGLAISERLVQMHGSQLGIESEPGKGTCFHFSLPFVAIQPEKPAELTGGKPRAGKAARILVIEDDPASGQLIESQLTSSGYEAIRCTGPERAVELAAERQPDAITLDLLMKPTNGLQILLQLKNDPRTSRIPIIVVTIVDQPTIGIALGADEYLVKPVEKAALLSAVERCLSSRGGTTPKCAILVVEDDVPTLEMIADLLTTHGYAVTTAADGALARDHVAHALPELVILDLLLPEISGLELLAEWRANPRTADLPVFVLTSKDLSKEEEKYVHAHAEALFRKQNSWREPLMKQLERVAASQILEDA